ncbi:hypothetical protein PMAYCL1PPCAC_09743, partial [Pristionchus mayeri]
QKEFTLAKMIEDNTSLLGAGYSIPRYLWIPIVVAVLSLTALTICVCGCIFFIHHTLSLLSAKSSTMSDRTRKLQRGLTITLVMQLTIPFVIQ